MTALGARPLLEELLAILHGIVRIEADTDAQRPEAPQFRVVLTFDRARLANTPWSTPTEPTPTWLFEGILEQLQAWLRQRIREEQWVAKEARFGAGVESVAAFLIAKEQEQAKKANKGGGWGAEVEAKLYANAISRLQELQERRAAGGVRNATEERREKARKAWMEDEIEGLKREEEQRQQRQKRAGADYTAWGAYDTGYSFFNDDTTFKPSPNKRRWFEVLDVTANATKEQIQKAYRKLAKQYQPRTSADAENKAMTEKMVELNLARDEGLQQ